MKKHNRDYVQKVSLSAEKNMDKLLEMLDDNDDVQNVWHNWEQE